MKQTTDALLGRGLEAVENDELDEAWELLGEASKLAGEDHAQVLHLKGMIAWAEGRPEQAMEFLREAADRDSHDSGIQLDRMECLLMLTTSFDMRESLDEAEAVGRMLLASEGVGQTALNQARLLLARIRATAGDTGDALELLRGISDEGKQDSVFFGTYGGLLHQADRSLEAIPWLRKAVDKDAEDADARYHLARALKAAGDAASATAEMLRVRELDAAESEESEFPNPPLTRKTEKNLLKALGALLKRLPTPLRKQLADLPTTVQTRATEAQVRAGMDPRSPLVLLGTPVGGIEASVTGIMLMYDLIEEAIVDDEDEEEISELLATHLAEELERFLR